MAQLNLPPPKPFDFRSPEKWPTWKRRFERYRSSCQLDRETDERQISTLLYCLGEEAEEILASINSAETAPETPAQTGNDRSNQEEQQQAQGETYLQVIEKFETFFGVRKNIIFERARFNRRNQTPGETAEQYIMALYKLAEDCNYGDLKSEMIRDRLVVGIRDTSLSERLQLDPQLTLEKAKKTIRQREAVKEQQKELSTNSGVDEVRASRRNTRNQYPKRQPTKTQSGSNARNYGNSKNKPRKDRCIRCGKDKHRKEVCPARDANCTRCGKIGHYSSVCLTKRTVAEVTSSYQAESNDEENDTSDQDSIFLDAITDQSKPRSHGKTKQWNAEISLNGVKEHFKIDTGAEVTAISETAYQNIGSPALRAPPKD